jgi:hypothetical protein
MVSKREVQYLFDKMSDNFSVESFIEKLTLLEKVKIGKQQIEDGVYFSEEEMDKLIDSWA